jgi:hypothetical protein
MLVVTVGLEQVTNAAEASYNVGRPAGRGLNERVPQHQRLPPPPDRMRRRTFLAKLTDRVPDPGRAAASHQPRWPTLAGQRLPARCSTPSRNVAG